MLPVELRSWKGTALLAWLPALAFLFAASWPHYSESELPLAGLSNLTNPVIGWPLGLITLAMAVFLSTPAFLSRERLLICAGFSFCLFAVTAFYASMVAAVIFFLLGVHLVRDSRARS